MYRLPHEIKNYGFTPIKILTLSLEILPSFCLQAESAQHIRAEQAWYQYGIKTSQYQISEKEGISGSFVARGKQTFQNSLQQYWKKLEVYLSISLDWLTLLC